MMQTLFNFNGRIRRSTFWLYSISLGVVVGVVYAIAAMLQGHGGALVYVGLAIELAAAVVAIWAGLALEIKRWHDRDKSWVWIFITFVPAIGSIWVLVECGILDGTQGPNRYGPSPKGLAAAATATA